MKKLFFLLVLLSLCIAPFWKSEYRKRWEAQQEENTEHQFVCGTTDDMISHEAVNHYQPPTNGVDGKALFKANCAACHNASQKRSTGPGLADVLGRIPSGSWRYDFIRDSKKVIASGDAYANAIFREYNKTPMGKFPKLTNEEIDEILSYCNVSYGSVYTPTTTAKE